MNTNATPADATPGAIADAALALHRADPYGHPELKQVRQAITSASVTYDPDNALQLHEVLDRSIHGAVSAQATAHKADPEAHPELKQLRRAVIDANIAYDPLDPTQLSQAIARAVEGVTVENASETVKGIVRLATPTETIAGFQSDIAVHPAGLKAAIAALINGAPGALDTLKELADALGNDANFAATITNALATKAPLASPALTGTPTAPTAAAGNNSQQIATTAFVQSLLTGQISALQASLSLLPIYPEIETPDNRLACAVSGNTLTVQPGQTWVMRGSRRHSTDSYTEAARTFSTEPSKTYHLRWTAAAGFQLLDLEALSYNPSSLPESDLAFDTAYDDMLVALVLTSATSAVTVTAAKNRHVLSGEASGASSSTEAHLKRVHPLNWARCPRLISFPSMFGSTTGGVETDLQYSATPQGRWSITVTTYVSQQQNRVNGSPQYSVQFMA